MRFWIGGPRIAGFRTGVSFGAGSLFGSSRRREEPRQAQQPRQASFDSHACVGGFVYVIEREGDRRVKIGSSINPPQRLASLQTGSADRLSIAYSLHVRGSAYAVEMAAHDILDRHRGFGEWFDTPIDIAVGVINAAAWRLDREGPAVPEAFGVERMSGSTKAGWIFAAAALAALLIICLSPKKPNPPMSYRIGLAISPSTAFRHN